MVLIMMIIMIMSIMTLRSWSLDHEDVHPLVCAVNIGCGIDREEHPTHSFDAGHIDESAGRGQRWKCRGNMR